MRYLRRLIYTKVFNSFGRMYYYSRILFYICQPLAFLNIFDNVENPDSHKNVVEHFNQTIIAFSEIVLNSI